MKLMILPQVHLRNGEFETAVASLESATMCQQPDYILNRCDESHLPTAILVCERHPVVKTGIGCWLSIVTSLSIMTIPSIANESRGH